MEAVRDLFSNHYGPCFKYDDDTLDLGKSSLSVRMLTTASLKCFKKRRLSRARKPSEVFHFAGRFYQIFFGRWILVCTD